MFRNWLALLVILGQVVILTGSDARAGSECKREDFAKVVDATGQALRDINGRNAPAFRARLRALKKAKGWSQEAFLSKAKPLVQDDQITLYDDTSDDLLAKINSLGDDTGNAEPDCLVLEELKSHLDHLIETINAKWAYMFANVEKALKSP